MLVVKFSFAQYCQPSLDVKTRMIGKVFLSMAVTISATTAFADTFKYDGDGGKCDWAEGQRNEYVQIGYEGLFFVDVTRGMGIEGGILKEAKLADGIYQYYVADEYGDVWVTFDPESGKLAEGKYADRATLLAVDWTTAANVVGLKPCDGGGGDPAEACDDCDTATVEEQPETATEQKRPTPQTCEDGIGVLISALKLRQSGYDLLGAHEKLLSDIQEDESLAYIAKQPTFSSDVMDTVRLAYSGQFDGFDLSMVQTMMVSNCLDQ